MDIYIYIYIHIYMCVCVCVCVYMCVCVCVHICVHVYIYTHTYIYIYIYIYMSVWKNGTIYLLGFLALYEFHHIVLEKMPRNIKTAWGCSGNVMMKANHCKTFKKEKETLLKCYYTCYLDLFNLLFSRTYQVLFYASKLRYRINLYVHVYILA